MKILYLGGIEEENFSRFLENFGIVLFYNKKFDDSLKIEEFDYIVSYGYKYIFDPLFYLKLKTP